MKIYILRHEDRTQDCSFFSPLTKEGLDNSIKLSDILKNEKIDVIYTSPYMRTLQTVYPYSIKYKIKVNLEYGLGEIQHQDIIAKKSIGIHIPEYIADTFNYNPNYKSIIQTENIKYPETINDIDTRVKQVLKSIVNKYFHTNNNILLVTHQSLCVNMARIHDKNYDIDYHKGLLCKIYDNKWLCVKVN
jgi:2,3-bisphosphoglycerate-dependent phosphoglycerate mutase